MVVHIEQGDTVAFQSEESSEVAEDTEKPANIVYRFQNGVKNHYGNVVVVLYRS